MLDTRGRAGFSKLKAAFGKMYQVHYKKHMLAPAPHDAFLCRSRSDFLLFVGLVFCFQISSALVSLVIAPTYTE